MYTNILEAIDPSDLRAPVAPPPPSPPPAKPEPAPSPPATEEAEPALPPPEDTNTDTLQPKPAEPLVDRLDDVNLAYKRHSIFELFYGCQSSPLPPTPPGPDSINSTETPKNTPTPSPPPSPLAKDTHDDFIVVDVETIAGLEADNTAADNVHHGNAHGPGPTDLE